MSCLFFILLAVYLARGSPAVVFRLVGSLLSFVTTEVRTRSGDDDTEAARLSSNPVVIMTVFDRQFELLPSERDLAVLRGLHKRRSCFLKGAVTNTHSRHPTLLAEAFADSDQYLNGSLHLFSSQLSYY